MTTSPMLSDDEVVARVRSGELEAYETVIQRYNQRLLRLVYPILGDRSESEDVVQETHLRAITHMHQFAGRSTFSTWLGRISVYEALGRLRGRRRFDTPELTRVLDWSDGGVCARDPEKQAIETELGSVLGASVRRLPLPYRTVVVARLVHELSTAETCALLRLTEETVKTRLHRAKAMLRRDLGTKFRSGRRTAATCAAASRTSK